MVRRRQGVGTQRDGESNQLNDVQIFFLGIMVAWTPSLLVLAFLLTRGGKE